MALSYSNTVGNSANSALTSMMGGGLTASALANAKAKGIGPSTVSLNPGQVTTSTQPTKSSASTVPVTTPQVKPQQNSTMAGTASAGSYKGVAITPGTDAQVAAQIAAIDARNSQPTVTSTVPSTSSSVVTPSTVGASSSTKTSTPAVPSYSGIVGNLVDIGNKGSSAVNAANKALVDFNKSVADTTEGIYSSPTSARVMQGRNQAIQVANAQKQAALAAGVTNALTQQGQQVNALNEAAGYAQPTQLTPGSILTNPLTGAGIAAGPTLGQPGQSYYDPLNPSAASANSASLVSGWASYLAGGGDPSQVPATVSGNAVLWQQTLNAAKQQNPNFDVNSALGAAQARQTTAGLTSGLAGSQANTQIITQGKQDIAQMQASLNTADQNVQNLVNIMNQSGINNYNLVPLNNIANKVRANLSDGAVLSYQTLLAGTRALLTSVYISRGLAPTDASSTADATLAKATTVQALIDQYNTAKSEATNLISSKQAQIDQAQSQLNASTSGSGTTASGANPWH